MAASRRACGSVGTTPAFATSSLAACNRFRLASALSSAARHSNPRGSAPFDAREHSAAALASLASTSALASFSAALERFLLDVNRIGHGGVPSVAQIRFE